MPLRDIYDRIACIMVLVFAAVVALWVVGPRFARWQANSTINQLVVRIEQAEDAEVRVPLRQLESWGLQGLDALVKAAASDRNAVASEAREIVEENFTNWKFRLIDAEESDTAFPRQLTLALENHAADFGVSGRQWVESLTLELIEATDKLPAKDTAQILDSCDIILSRIPARGPLLRTVSTGNAPSTTTVPPTPSPSVSVKNLAIPSESVIQQQLTTMEARSAQLATESLAEGDSSYWNPDWKGNDQPQPIAEVSPEPTAIPSPVTTDIVESNDNVRPENVISPSPKTVAIIDVPNPHEIRSYLRQYRAESSDVLMQKMPMLDFYQAGAVREILRGRGFDDRELALIQRLSSSDYNDRLILVEDLSQLSAHQARRWLRELTKDDHPQVRIKALAALSTSNAPEVYDLARDMALHDQDRKVVEMASRIMKQIQR